MTFYLTSQLCLTLFCVAIALASAGLHHGGLGLVRGGFGGGYGLGGSHGDFGYGGLGHGSLGGGYGLGGLGGSFGRGYGGNYRGSYGGSYSGSYGGNYSGHYEGLGGGPYGLHLPLSSTALYTGWSLNKSTVVHCLFRAPLIGNRNVWCSTLKLSLSSVPEPGYMMNQMFCNVPPKAHLANRDAEQYAAANSLRFHPAQATLIDLTQRHPYGVMIGDSCVLQHFQLLLRAINAKKYLEVGTYTGCSALAAALAMPPDGRVITLDMFECLVDLGRPFWKQVHITSY
ncbi:putative caffeoyl-CoA O-methyltransferase 1 [Ixodes scapularis]